jgi:non-canonical (house-cleaning) NTP pyrophosphatase
MAAMGVKQGGGDSLQDSLQFVMVGSTNACKVQAVAQTLAGYPRYASLAVEGFKATSDVSEQPRR